MANYMEITYLNTCNLYVLETKRIELREILNQNHERILWVD